MERCWKCDNCKELKKSKEEVLRRHPPFTGVKPPQEVRDFWQQEQDRLPCLLNEKTSAMTHTFGLIYGVKEG